MLLTIFTVLLGFSLGYLVPMLILLIGIKLMSKAAAFRRG